MKRRGGSYRTLLTNKMLARPNRMSDPRLDKPGLLAGAGPHS